MDSRRIINTLFRKKVYEEKTVFYLFYLLLCIGFAV